MIPSSVRRKIRAGGPVITAKSSYHHPEIVELIGALGFDAVWICLEHKRVDPALVTSLIQACRINRIDALVRIKPANYSDLLWILEAGARGVMLPRVRTVDEVRDAISNMKFHPVGHRGFDGIQAEAGFGRVPPPVYMADANAESFLVVQIEEPEVVPHIDAIAALPGVDILFVGPADLTLGLGNFGALQDPQVQAIIHQVSESCQRHGKVAGIPVAAEKIPAYRAIGYNFFNVISDFRCVRSGLTGVLSDLSKVGIQLATSGGG